MAVFEWNGLVRITVGELSRAEQIDLFKVYSQSEWYDDTRSEGIDYTLRLMETDAMVTAAATRKIEVCKSGKWIALKSGDSHSVLTPDGDSFNLAYPVLYKDINHCPRSLGDQWIEAGTAKNGGLNANLTFFSSLRVTSGKTNSEPESDAPQSNMPKTATS